MAMGAIMSKCRGATPFCVAPFAKEVFAMAVVDRGRLYNVDLSRVALRYGRLQGKDMLIREMRSLLESFPVVRVEEDGHRRRFYVDRRARRVIECPNLSIPLDVLVVDGDEAVILAAVSILTDDLSLNRPDYERLLHYDDDIHRRLCDFANTLYLPRGVVLALARVGESRVRFVNIASSGCCWSALEFWPDAPEAIYVEDIETL